MGSHLSFYDFTACEIMRNQSFTENKFIERMTEHSRGHKAGRPRKYANGWGNANTRIYISKESHELWKKLWKE